jgi:hypothetical protein
MSWLRPHPHRGDLIAAGAVPLSLFAFVVSLRMTQWGVGARFVVVGLIAALLLTMGLLAPLEEPDDSRAAGSSEAGRRAGGRRAAPRAYHSVLLVAGLLPLVVALQELAEVLGSSRPPGQGADVWTFGLLVGAAAAAARRANSAVCTLIAALAGAAAVEEFVSWVFHPRGAATFRAMLVVLAIGFVAGALRLRDRHRRHSVQLINAAGLVTLLLGVTYLAMLLVREALQTTGQFLTLFGGGGETAPFGWKLYLLAVGLGLVAYAGVDGERGPAYIGVTVLAAFALLAGVPVSGRGSLVGWPLFLLLIGGAGLAIGLRPRKPLPPPPAHSEAAPTVPLHSIDER